MPPIGTTPGIRRPVRTITDRRSPRGGSGSASRRRRAPPGVIVAAFRPQPVLPDRRGGLVDDGVLRRPPVLERQVEPGELELEPDHVGLQDAERLLEQLLAGLVALEHDDRVRCPRRPRLPCALSRLGSRRGTERGSAPPRLEESRLSLLRRQGSRDHRSREARADRPAADSAGVARRLDRAQGRARSCRRSGSTVPGASSTSTRPRYRAQQEQAKYDKLVRFGERLPAIRTAMAEDMDREHLDRERVCAIALRLINLGLVSPRLGALREGVAHVRDHDAAQAPRHGAREQDRAQLPRQAQGVGSDRGRSTQSWPSALKELLDLRGGRGLFRYRGEDGDAREPDRSAPQPVRAGAHGGRLHGQGLPHVGRHAPRGDRPRRARRRGDGDAGEEERDRGVPRASRRSSATRPRSAAPPTSARR